MCFKILLLSSLKNGHWTIIVIYDDVETYNGFLKQILTYFIAVTM